MKGPIAMMLLGAVAAKKALVVIDVQNCFIEGGSLAVPGGAALVPLINNLRDTYDGVLWDEVVISQDWHPKPHASFASANNASMFSFKNLTYNKNKDLCQDGVIEKHINSTHIVDCGDCMDPDDPQCEVLVTLEQRMWPDHCVQNTTAGSDADIKVNRKPTDFIQQKGQQPWIDSYSAFFSNGGLFPTGLEDHLKGKGVDTVFVMGIASDFCVKFSSIDAQSVGFKTYMVKDASAGIENDLTPSYEEMAAAGVTVVTTADLAKMVDSNATTTAPTTEAPAGSSATRLYEVFSLVYVGLFVVTCNL